MKRSINVSEWLGENNKLGQDIWNRKYRYKNESLKEWIERVSGGDKELTKLITERKFLFGGRTLASRGTGNGMSFSNCYSSGYAPDSVEGMLELNKNLALTYQASGGQGLSLSHIRPKGSDVRGGLFKSDGIVPFMELFNQTTASISQGGSRKGALMMSLSVWHPEIGTFISIKDGTGKITKANLSVEIDDAFMQLIDKGITEYQYMTFGKTYTINPMEIYNKIMERAWSSAEPGVIFTNRFRNYNMMELHDEYEIVTSNPCGEQPLPKDGACNLGSMNLAEYVIYPFTKDASFDFDEFIKDVAICVKALDDVLEEGKDLHALQSQREMAANYRNIGLGIMGYGTMLMKMGIPYGSENAKKMTDSILSNMLDAALRASAHLAKEKGTFPKFNKKILKGEFFNNVKKETMSMLKKYGLRNCSLLSIAPSGSIGTMLDVSTGLEPYYALSYKRKTESLHGDKDVYYTVDVPIAIQAREAFGDEVCVSALDIDWRDRVEVQGIMQTYIDTAISSTVNVAQNTTVNELRDLYWYAWKCGLKGITIYREGSFDAILYTGNEKKEEDKVELKRGDISPKPKNLIGHRVEIKHGCGVYTLHVYVNPETKKVFDCYINSKSNGCISNVQAIAVTISLLLRSGVSLDRIHSALNGMGSCPSFMVGKLKHGCSEGRSCSTAIVRALQNVEKLYVTNNVPKETPVVEKEATAIVSEITEENQKYICPDCGAVLRPMGGCYSCDCGYTKCE